MDEETKEANRKHSEIPTVGGVEGGGVHIYNRKDKVWCGGGGGG